MLAHLPHDSSTVSMGFPNHGINHLGAMLAEGALGMAIS
jgi:hypothetical protein